MVSLGHNDLIFCISVTANRPIFGDAVGHITLWSNIEKTIFIEKLFSVFSGQGQNMFQINLFKY